MKTFFSQTKPSDFNIPKGQLNQSAVDEMFQLVFMLAGAVAVVVLMWAGLKYILARGEPADVAKAKNMIIYAIVGLAVSMAAFSIVGFVVNRV